MGNNKKEYQLRKNYKYIFGPVPSRRLGHSLGVDVVPYKVCTLDCIYCELGATTNKTIEKKEYNPLNDMVSELKEKLKENIKIDYVTIAGSGEPTLFLKIGELISEIKKITQIPVAVLTNGTMLWDENVRSALKNADLVIPSIDAGNKEIFDKVNKPSEKLDFSKVIKGIQDFSKEFVGKIWVEILLVKGFSDSEKNINDILEILKSIRYDKIQLGTVDRPPTEQTAYPLTMKELEIIKQKFPANTEIISTNSNIIADDNFFLANEIDILSLLERRPCSIEDISKGLQIHKNEVIKYIDKLYRDKKIKKYYSTEKEFYCII